MRYTTQLYGLLKNLTMPESTFVATRASRFRLVIFDIRDAKIRTKPFEVLALLPQRICPLGPKKTLEHFFFELSPFRMCLRLQRRRRRLCILATITSAAETARMSS